LHIITMTIFLSLLSWGNNFANANVNL
jgi:hypothetical protein